MNSTTNLRTTNPRGRPNPLAELSIDYPSAHRQMAVPRFGLGGLPGLRHQIPCDALAGVALHIHRCCIRATREGDGHRISSVG